MQFDQKFHSIPDYIKRKQYFPHIIKNIFVLFDIFRHRIIFCLFLKDDSDEADSDEEAEEEDSDNSNT